MKNLQNNEIIKILSAIIVILVIGFGIYIFKGKTTDTKNIISEENNVVSTTTSSVTTNVSKPKTTTTLSDKCNLKITYPAPGSKVSFPLTIKGTIDNSKPQSGGCSWNEILGQAGSAQLFYKSGSMWKSQSIPVPILTNSSSVASTSVFSVALSFYNNAVGLASGSPMKVTFIENPVGISNLDTFDFYIYIK